ncbi:MAG TPA: hypothetical protein VGR35_17815 [Tepidisphaeraceae bacterium]|nr:hypothetical protein [Tepidisphaeraceae bacterium]
MYALLSHNAARWGLGTWWTTRSTLSLVLMLMLSVAACLFTLWSIYLFVRFALAFRRAARELRGRWTVDDASLAPAPRALTQ